MIFKYSHKLYEFIQQKEQSLGFSLTQVYLFQFAAVGFNLLTNIIIARALTPDQKGVVDLYLLLSQFVVEVGTLGIGSSLLFHLANRGKSLSHIHGTGIFFIVLMSIPTFVAGWLGLPLWIVLFSGLPVWVIIIVFFLAPFAYYRQIWINLMLGLGNAILVYRVAFFVAVVNLIILAGLWLSHQLTVERAIIISILLLILNGLAAFRLVWKRAPDLKVNIPLFREVVSYGLPIYLGFVVNLLHFRLDQLMVSSMLGTSELAIYAVSVRWAEMLFLLDSVITSASLQKVSSLPASEGYLLTQRLLKLQTKISLGLGGGLAIVAYPLIATLYGRSYLESVIPLVILLPGIASWSLAKIMSQYIYYNRGRKWLTTIIAITSVVTNMLLNQFFIPRAGIIGASIASSISYGLLTLITFVMYRRIRAATI